MSQRHAGQGDTAPVFILAIVMTLMGTLLSVDLAITVSDWWAGGPWGFRNPFEAIILVVTGQVEWTATATLVVVAELAVLAVLATLFVLMMRNRHKDIDKAAWNDAARRMGNRRDERAVHGSATSMASRLGVNSSETGVLCGRSVRSHQLVYAPWEYLHLDIWGIGRGKTTARVVPAILRAPGAVVSTSNKPEVMAKTRKPRDRMGYTWVFDPQDIAGEHPTWWWNPLRGIDTLTKAEELAEVLADAKVEDKQKAREDSFFDPKARKLLALALYAAAVSGRPVTDIYFWLTDPRETAMEEIFQSRSAAIVGAALGALRRLPDKTRDSVYASAELYVDWLLNDEIVRWITPGGGRQEFVPETFVTSRDTLYLISRKGKGSASPLTTALTATTMRAAEDYATKGAMDGRLNPPMLAVLDEVANVCRWRQLPEMYSHYRSRGIVLMTFLQSWSQGVQLWGPEGMKILWDAATAKLYGGGSGEGEFLKLVSETVGEWEAPHRTANADANSLWLRSGWQDTTQRKSILPVADLAALPEGRIVALLAGVRPLMLDAEYYFRTEDAGAVAESERVYGVRPDQRPDQRRNQVFSDAKTP
ncbi:MAG: type IV secretory system conjugative DNA transfer family protein [Streptosporangiales bacterium]